MKKYLIYSLVGVVTIWSLFGPVLAQDDTGDDPSYRVLDESYDDELLEPLYDPARSPEDQAQLELDASLGSIHEELNRLSIAFGYAPTSEESETPDEVVDDETEDPFQKGALGALKLKPSDKKRLIKIANGSLTENQKERVQYDARLLDLLTQLTAPKAFGGAGLEHLRIHDLLRFKHDPRSRETEGADNVSAHWAGRAADVTEINTTYCVEKSSGALGIGGSKKKLPPFPVKVIWQGGAPQDPSASQLGSFDAVARANAFRDILGALPASGYNGAIQGLTDLLQQVQRRVIANDLGLDPNSLDFVTNNDVLETLGRAAVTKELGFAPGALTGNSKEEVLRSIPRAALERSLTLPAGSLQGDTWNDALQTLGVYKAALDVNVDPKTVLQGQTDALKNSPYHAYYRNAEDAFRMPSGTLEGVRANRPEAFRQVGARLIADRLHYSPEEATELINQAKAGKVSQLSLARYGDLTDFPSDKILTLLAPGPNSSKKAGELFLAKHLTAAKSNSTIDTLDEAIRTQIDSRFPTLRGSAKRGEITNALSSDTNNAAMYRRIGASKMEQAFDLPEDSLVQLLNRNPNPTLAQYGASVGPTVMREELASTFTDDDLKLFPKSQHPSLKSRDLASYFSRKQYPEVIDKRLYLAPGTTAKRYTNTITPSEYTRLVGNAYMENDFRDTFNDMYHTSSVGLGKVTLEEMWTLVLGQINPAATRSGASWVEEDLGLAPDSFAVFFSAASADERLVHAGITVLGGNLFEAFEIDGANVPTLAVFKQRIGQAKIETLLGLKPGSFKTSLSKIKADNPRFNQIFASPDMVDAILGVTAGTTKQFLAGSVAPSELINKVGDLKLQDIDVATLHTKLGWDDRFKLFDPNAQSGNIVPTTGGSKNKAPKLTDYDGAQLRALLAKIGGYNSDYAFGYDPGTMDRWVKAGSSIEQDQILLTEGGKLYAERIGFDTKSREDILNSYRTGGNEFKQRAITKLREITSIPNQTDLASFVGGDMYRATFSRIAASQAKNNTVTFKQDPYEIYHALTLGWSNDRAIEQTLSQAAQDRYGEVLKDYALTKQGSLDSVFERITQGVLNSNGSFVAGTSPYSNTTLTAVKAGYFAGKEARADYFYGAIDTAIRKKTSTIPQDFSKTIMEGSNADRSRMIYTFLGTKVGDGILTSLPAELQPIASGWLNDLNPTQGQSLATNAAFTDWASQTFAKYTDTIIPAGTMQLAAQYISGNLNTGAIQENPGLVADLSPDVMAGLINKQLGLDSGVFGEYHTKYRQVQSLVAEYKAGNLDVSQAAFAIDSLVFGGKIAQFTHSIDDALGLPPGSSQLLISYALTQNPVYLGQFAMGVVGGLFGFGGKKIECPDLQKEAQKNIKKLIASIIEQGEKSARVIPSQIITLNEEYIDELKDKIQQNYFHCEEGSRCGVFARPEYAKQVHIGF